MNHTPEPQHPTQCQRCGELFNTSSVHPQPFCSIACEEGRSALPINDPASPDFPQFVQGNPGALVGYALIADGLKRTCYSPDWHRDPESYRRRDIVTHDEENEILVYKTDVYLGYIMDYSEGEFTVERTDDANPRKFTVDESTMLHQLRRGRWWCD